MIAPEFITFHGSPGTPYDFYPLELLFVQAKWKNFIRYTETCPKASSDKRSYPIALGYSFGCISALKAAASDDNIKALVLIAPYVHNTKQSLLKKLIVVAPVIGEKILAKKAPQAIDEFVVKSSYPDKPTPGYLKYAEHLKNPKLLQGATWEKSDHDAEVLEAIDKINKRGIPVLIMWGEGDQTSTRAEQIDPLMKRLENVELFSIKGGGHALCYTRTAEIAGRLADFCRVEIKKVFISDKVLEKQKAEVGEFDYLDPAMKFGKHKGESKLNNISSFLYHHVLKDQSLGKQTDILTWVHPNHLTLWREGKLPLLPHGKVAVEDLDLLVGKIAAGLKAQGLEKGDRVILFIPMSLYLYGAMFAVQKIGAVAVFLDSWARRDQMGVAVNVVSPKGIISVEKAYEYLDHIPEIKNIPLRIVGGPHTGEYSETLENLMMTDDYEFSVPVESEHTALITFTTGSSGTPKGADRSHRFLAAQHYALNRHLPYESGDADLPAFPIFSLNNLAAGVTTVIPAFDVGTPHEDDAKIILEQFKQTNTTATTLSPSLFRTLYNHCLAEGITLGELKRIVTGGAPVGRDDIEKMSKVAPNAEILVLYGSTEVEPMAHIEAKEMLAEVPADTDERYVTDGVNVGHFDEGLEVKFIKIIKDPITIGQESEWADIEVEHGQVGEIIVSGEHVCERYFNNEEATQKTKIKDNKNRIWHRTGDLGRMDKDHNLWLVGRVHNAINRGGNYLFPVHAEFVMKKSNFVDKAAFLGIEDQELGEKTVAVCQLKAGLNKEEAIAEIKDRLAYNKILCDHFIIIDDIPMDPRHHSKVEYGKLKESIHEQGLLK